MADRGGGYEEGRGKGGAGADDGIHGRRGVVEMTYEGCLDGER